MILDFFKFLTLSFIISLSCLNIFSQGIDIEIESKKKEANKIALIILSNDKNDLTIKIGEIIAKALGYDDQFNVTFEVWNKIKSKDDIKKLAQRDCILAIFINGQTNNFTKSILNNVPMASSITKAVDAALPQVKDNKLIEWRIYDTLKGDMLLGKVYKRQNKSLNGDAYNLADQIWQAITSEKGSFSSKIAFIKRKNFTKQNKTIICVSDYDGQSQQLLSPKPGNFVGLYWDTNLSKHRIFCSEFTRYNVRLISFSLDKTKKIVFNFDGTCVGISLSPDNSQAVYCRSGDIWYCKYDPILKNTKHVNLIKNDGKNFYPILLPNGDIIFCSDAAQLRQQSKNASGPQICYFNSKDKTIDLITTDGYNIAPAYSNANKKLVYSKRVNGYYQLFIYDLNEKKHVQLTFDSADKIDPCWSYCGNYLVFCYKKNKTSQIAQMHTKLKKLKFLTSINDYCESPAWSGAYVPFATLG